MKRFPHSFARAAPDMTSLSPSESLNSKSSYDLFLTWRSAKLNVRKKITEMPTRTHGENHNIEQTKKVSRVKFLSMSAGWLLMSIHLIWILGSQMILSKLLCLQNCTTETHFQKCEKNVCWWARNPHHSVDQPSVFF